MRAESATIGGAPYKRGETMASAKKMGNQ